MLDKTDNMARRSDREFYRTSPYDLAKKIEEQVNTLRERQPFTLISAKTAKRVTDRELAPLVGPSVITDMVANPSSIGRQTLRELSVIKYFINPILRFFGGRGI